MWVTLWYRSPELLGGNKYPYGIDDCSCGCVIAEMINNKPIFIGYDETETLFKIFNLLWTPTKETWTDVVNLPYYNDKIPKLKYSMDNESYDIKVVKGLLTLDPKKENEMFRSYEFILF